ncbi:DNA-3-methyladenine glycosylase [Methylorubrum sp. POS3]
MTDRLPHPLRRPDHALPFRAPFDWARLTAFLADHATPGIETVTAEAYARTVRTGDDIVILRVAPAEDETALHVWLDAPRGASGIRGAMQTRLRTMFDLDADPESIAAGLSHDPFMAELVQRRPGLRIPGAFDPFELTVRAILGQQVSVAAATQLAGRLVSAFGTPLPAAMAVAGLTHVFPEPGQLVEADISLRLNMPRARGRAIQSLASAFLHAPDLFAIGLGLDESVARLTALPGIGPWTAHYVAMRALGQADAFPPGDIGLMRALDGGQGRPSRTAILARSQAWRPWRAYAALHLWAEDAERRGASRQALR